MTCDPLSRGHRNGRPGTPSQSPMSGDQPCPVLPSLVTQAADVPKVTDVCGPVSRFAQTMTTLLLEVGRAGQHMVVGIATSPSRAEDPPVTRDPRGDRPVLPSPNPVVPDGRYHQRGRGVRKAVLGGPSRWDGPHCPGDAQGWRWLLVLDVSVQQVRYSQRVSSGVHGVPLTAATTTLSSVDAEHGFTFWSRKLSSAASDSSPFPALFQPWVSSCPPSPPPFPSIALFLAASTGLCPQPQPHCRSAFRPVLVCAPLPPWLKGVSRMYHPFSHITLSKVADGWVGGWKDG